VEQDVYEGEIKKQTSSPDPFSQGRRGVRKRYYLY
jgi:hypothetical protein